MLVYYFYIQINAIIEDDPFEAIEGHFESDSDSDNDDNNEEFDIRDGIPVQNLDDMLLNAVAEELMGNDNNSAENEDEELPVPGPSLRRNNGDEIGIQADPERESRRMRDRFEDLIRARFGHDGDVSERRQCTGRFNVV